MDGEAEDVDGVDAVLGNIAAQAGGTVRREPRAGREVRRVVLRDLRDELGSQSEVAVVEDDVLDLLGGHYERTGGRIGDLLRRPEVAAEFSNWHG